MLNTKFCDLSSETQQMLDELAVEAGYESFEQFFTEQKEQFDCDTHDDVTLFDALDYLMQAFPEGE